MIASARLNMTVSEPLFAQIGAMLLQHALDPSPTNYALCHSYLSDGESLYAIAIDRLITRFGGLTPQAVHELGDPNAQPISADTLRDVADEATAYLERLTGIADDTGDAVSAYGAALLDRAGSLSDPAQSSLVIEEMVALTRRMIERSRDASDHLRRTGAEMDTLRSKLFEARQIADSDALTGLPNRRALDARMTEACETARQNGAPLAVAICDIDHFKRVNDEHGHLIGDEVIKMIATAFGTAGDAFVSRYGGEEFVILFEGATAEAAATRIDTIRRAVAIRDIRVSSTGRQLGHVTFSAGVAAMAPGGTAPAMLRRADKALYRAKNEGRDRVRIDTGRD